MKINGGSTRGILPPSVRESGAGAAEKAEQGAGKPRTDSVELSEAGRAKAAESVSDPRAARLLEIRQRILHGAYDTDAVVAEVARRIIDRGDLQPIPPTESS